MKQKPLDLPVFLSRTRLMFTTSPYLRVRGKDQRKVNTQTFCGTVEATQLGFLMHNNVLQFPPSILVRDIVWF